MTVSTTTAKVSYTGNGSTTAFAVPFVFFSSSELEVIERTIATGAEVVKTLTTHYTVTGGDGATGTVTALTAPASTVEWHIRRKTARTQLVDYQANDAFPADTHERALDRAAARDQEIEETVGRALVFPKTDSASLDPELPASVDRASKYLAFDVDGSPVATAGTTSDIVATPFAETLLDDIDAAAARATLSAYSQSEVNALIAAVTAAIAAAVPTGTMHPYLGTTAPSGWILAWGTIGDASSSATNRANADTAALFTLIWNSFADAEAAVSGGRGASAAADFAAHKRIAVPDLRDRVPVGKGNMGGSAASLITTGGGGFDTTVQGKAGGAQNVTLTTAQMPAHSHTLTASGGASFITNAGTGTNGGGAGTGIDAGTGTSSVGGGGSHPNVQPSIALPYIIRL